jgi:hypothetical protein
MAEIRTQKPFEKPEGGMYLGTIIDVVDKKVPDIDFKTKAQKLDSNNQPKMKDQVTFVWTLAYFSGQPAVDSEGRPFQVFETYDAYQNPSKPSKLDQALSQILNSAPPLLSDTAQLEPLLMNRQSQLFIMKTPKVNNPNEKTVKVAGHTPLQPGQVGPAVPAGFVRAKNRTQQTAGPQPGQTTQTYAAAPQQAQPVANAASLNAAPAAPAAAPVNVPQASGSPQPEAF